jgi:hypothetical protein
MGSMMRRGMWVGTWLMAAIKMNVTEFLPRWAVEVALTVHHYEVVLACLAIVVWHFYHVMLDPGCLSAESSVLGWTCDGTLAA